MICHVPNKHRTLNTFTDEYYARFRRNLKETKLIKLINVIPYLVAIFAREFPFHKDVGFLPKCAVIFLMPEHSSSSHLV